MTACCLDLEFQLTNVCAKHGIDCPDNVVRVDEGGRYGIRIPGGAGGGMYLVRFCPWCGTKLPVAQADVQEDQ